MYYFLSEAQDMSSRNSIADQTRFSISSVVKATAAVVQCLGSSTLFTCLLGSYTTGRTETSSQGAPVAKASILHV
jgi:hypothetical protein